MLNIPSLTHPISPGNISGGDIREDKNKEASSLYYQMREARLNARSIEKRIADPSPSILAREPWEKVYDLGIQILTFHSKDLQVTTWLIEALVRLQSFKGLAEGFQLAYTLIENYWEELYPQIRGGNLENRLASLRGLNGEANEGTLIFPILNVPLTQSKSSLASYSAWQYRKALELERIVDPIEKDAKLLPGVISLKTFNQAARETPKEFFQEIFQDLNLALKELELLEAKLNEKCGPEAPSFYRIKGSLILCNDYLKSFAKEWIFSTNKEQEKTNGQPSLSEEAIGDKEINMDREAALISLSEIADFFSNTEPHSPLPYLIRKAVRWGNTPLPNLLIELVEDEGVLSNIFRNTGIDAMVGPPE